MPAHTEAQKRDFTRSMLELFTQEQARLTALGFNAAARITELEALADLADQKQAAQTAAQAAAIQATADSVNSTAAAYDAGTAAADLIVGLVGKSDPLARRIRDLRPGMSKPKSRGPRPATPPSA